MNIAPVSFRGIHCLDINTMGKDKYWDEIKKSMIARQSLGTDVPKMVNKTQKGATIVQFTTRGKKADIKNNPITKEHLVRLVDDFRRLDEIGMFHEDLTLDNVHFYTSGEKSGVEITGFKDAGVFNLKAQGIGVTSKRRINDIGFEMPSNAKNFEERGLQEYLATIKNYDERFNFIEDYLKIKAPYHEERALKRLENNELGNNDKSIEYEALKGSVFKNPSRDIVKFELAKIEYGTGVFRNNAIEMWNKGNKNIDPTSRFNAVLLMLEALKSAVDLKETIDMIAENNHPYPEDKYFEFEKENTKNLINNIYNQAILLGDDNFNNHTLYKGRKILDIGSENDKKKFHALCDELKDIEDTDEIKEKINDIIKFYGYLATRWISERY